MVDVITIDDNEVVVSLVDLEDEENTDAQKKCDTLLAVLPDVDPVYAREMSVEYAFRQEDFEQFVAQVIESGDYPKVQAQTSDEELPPRPPQKEFSVEEFLEKFPQPLEVFQNRCRKNSNEIYKSLSLEYLKERFKYCSMLSIKKAYQLFDCNLTKTVKHLEMQPRSRKSKRTKFEIVRVHTYNQDFDDEVNFLEHETEIIDYITHKTEERRHRLEGAKSLGELLVCGCCFSDDLLIEDMIPCDEGHLFCRTCVKCHANITIGENKVKFPCLQECSSHFSLDKIKLVVNNSVYEKLLKRLQEFEVKAAGIEGLVFCPFCEYAEIPPEGDRIFKCKSCLKESCIMCRKESHIPYKCDEATDNRLTKIRTDIEERISECLIRTCPSCQRKFIKEDGCNKMTCSCGATMCYLCRKPVTDYKHFNHAQPGDSNKCPLYSNNNELHYEAIEKEAEKLKAEALAKEPTLVDKLDPLKGLRRSPSPRSHHHHAQGRRGVHVQVGRGPVRFHEYQRNHRLFQLIYIRHQHYPNNNAA